MFRVGEYVVYGTQGVCKIERICRENFSGEMKDYYILTPADDPKMQIYVPTDAPLLTEQMRALLSAEELMSTLRMGIKEGVLEWVSDPRGRNEQYRRILQEGDRCQLFRLLRTLYQRREEQAAVGRKLYAADEQIFERAQRLLHGEIAVILNIHPDEVSAYIGARLGVES